MAALMVKVQKFINAEDAEVAQKMAEGRAVKKSKVSTSIKKDPRQASPSGEVHDGVGVQGREGRKSTGRHGMERHAEGARGGSATYGS